MGLDMYLTGEKFFWNAFDKPEEERREDGYAVQSINVRLGYWRKHPDLHGFIVQSFADGEDNCRPIELDADDINKIIAAVKDGRLPKTSGFFFGQSDNDAEMRHDVETFEKALQWLRSGDDSPVRTGVPTAIGGGFTIMEVKPVKAEQATQRVTRRVVYEASW